MGLTYYIPILIAWSSFVGGVSVESPQKVVERPKNIVLIIGDGMGLAHVAAAIHDATEPLLIEDFPVVGLQKTHSASHLVTDSGAGATAMSCGVKTYNSGIGMSIDTLPVKNLMEYAEEGGKSTGIIVTSSLVNATPAAFVAHQMYRGFQEAIAADYLELDLDYVVGGGLVYFSQRYSDDRDLLKELKGRGYLVGAYHHESFKKFSSRDSDKAYYFTAHDIPLPHFQGRDYLPLAATHGLNLLDRREDNGFFLMIEASQIDHASHAQNLGYLLSEMRDLNETLAAVMAFARGDGETLVIVTADHATGGLYIQNGKPGKGKVRAAFTTKHHTADMVPVYAYGPGAEFFSGIYDNTEIFQKIRQVGGF
ncbi:MAG: alkaline phosphatase [Saprospiraceae bacterium]|nr:alkaline phosphatase [Saprospiraceae bacterium]